MKLFLPKAQEEYEYAQLVDPDGYIEVCGLIDGTPRGDAWVPFPVRLITQEKRRRLRQSDAPWLLGSILVIRREAADVLSSFVSRYGEFLPLACEQVELVALNPLRVVDALDEGVSIVERFGDGRVMWIHQYAFKKTTVEGLPFFKITSLHPSPVFVGEEFVDHCHAAGFKGLEFQKVWEA